MASMSAYRIPAWGAPPALVEVAVPEPGPGQARVRVAGCGLCHSDLAMAQMPAELGESMGWSMPFTLGHEVAGWVDALGPGVDGPAPGTSVAVASPSSCGRCRWCLRGSENSCSSGLVGRGYGRDGGLASFVLVDDPTRVLVPLGSLAPTIAGPLTDAGATAHHAVARVAPRVSADAAVVVIGIGGLGSFALQLARELTSAARLVAIEPHPTRRARAAALGAHDVIDGVGDSTRADLASLLDGQPVDAVVDLVGTDATILLGAGLVAPGGALAVVGAGGGTLRRPWFGGLPRDAEVFSFQNSDLADLRSVVALAQDGRIEIDAESFPLAEVERAYTHLEAGIVRGRAVVQPPT